MRAGVARKTAFSLAEMMIALVILGFGLLVIGAALPVGLQYERDMIDRATGQAAAEYALDVIEQRIRLVRDPYDETLGKPSNYADIFQPRYGEVTSLPVLAPGGQSGELAVLPDERQARNALAPGGQSGELAVEVPTAAFPNGRLWEPRIKVRPLLTNGINLTYPRVDEFEPSEGPQAAVERQIVRWFTDVIVAEAPEYLERDGDDNWTASTLSSVSAAYPPVSHESPFRASDFLASPEARYIRTQTSEAARRKLLETAVTWVAFYRRISYAEGSDPNLYEVIALATRRPQGYFYPWYDSDNVLQKAVAPVPWLVVFQGVAPALRRGPDYVEIPRPEPYSPDRVLNVEFREPATLTFTCDDATGYLFPPGSIFLPAVNDELLSVYAASFSPRPQFGGFIPHSPEALPIYEVTARERNAGGGWSIIVKNNGFYPWVQGDPASDLRHWPVWVIPPAFKEKQTIGGRQFPVCDAKSPVLAVARRIIRFTEVP